MQLVRTLFILISFVASASAFALDVLPYSLAALKHAQQSGSAYAMHFHADWCPVCRAQSIVINKLKADPKLNVTVFVVDYDAEKALRKPYGVHTQSTLIAFRGMKETDRLAGETDPDRIRAVLDSAL